MIDTVKLSIFKEYNKSIYDLLLYNSKNCINGFIVNSHTGHNERTEMFVYDSTHYHSYESFRINGSFIPSWNYNINYRVFEDRIELEFSLPKFIYGTNVIQLCDHITRISSPYQMLTKSLKKFFSVVFSGCLVDYGGIEIKRWDFCFNQFFESEEKVYEALKYIKLKYASKNDKLSYDTGLVELTKSNYLKIYMKGVEFEKHDKRKLDCFSHDVLNKIENISKLILRYEKKCTNKNVSYWYNSNIINNNVLFNEYKKLKNKLNKNEIVKFKVNVASHKMESFEEMRKIFENVRRFTLGKTKMIGFIKLDEIAFNHLFNMFRDEIKSKFDVSKTSIDQFKKEIISGNKKNKVLKVKILSLIKSFRSLKRAYENGAISKPTYYRYVKFLNDNNIDQVNKREKIDIRQDWTNLSYYSYLFKNGLLINNLIKDTSF